MVLWVSHFFDLWDLPNKVLVYRRLSAPKLNETHGTLKSLKMRKLHVFEGILECFFKA
jgi:hypothetical protein